MRTTERSLSRFAALALPIALALAAPPTPLPATEPGPADPDAASRELVERAAALLAESRPTDAALLLDRALEWTPEDPRAVALRAEARRRSDRLELARADYQRLAELTPGDPEPWFWLGTIHRWQGRPDEAVAGYTRALEIEPSHLGAWIDRARVHLARDGWAAAEADLRQALVLEPGEPEATRLLAETLAHGGATREARRVLASAFHGTELERRLGDLALATGRSSRAAGHYRRALRRDPTDADLHRRLGDAAQRLGRTHESHAAYREAARLEPDHVGTLYWLGIMSTRAGRLDESLAAWEAMLRREPDNVGALNGKARVLFFQGDREASLRLTERALAVDPGNGESRTLRASILAAAGRLHEAEEDYRSVLAAEPRNVDARIGYERLADTSAWEVVGRSDRSRVVEGLDEEGIEVDGVLIQATRIEYLSEGVEAGGRWQFANTAGLDVRVRQRREAVTNLDTGGTIYDFDVFEASSGLEHRLGGAWRLSWRLGGSRYDPRIAGTIQEEDRFTGSAALEWSGRGSRVSASVARAPFVYRGFAGDTQFALFDHTRGGLGWERALGGAWRLEAAAAVSDYEQDDVVANGSLAIRWRRAGSHFVAGLEHTPFPERFLAPGGELRFIDFDGVFLDGRSEIGLGFRALATARLGEIGATPRIVDLGDGRRVAGPRERNTQLSYRAGLAWSPRQLRQLSIGVERSADEFDFDTGPYNTIDREATTAFVEIAGRGGGRLDYRFRWGHGLVDDERDPDYATDDLHLRLELRLGPVEGPARPIRVGIEAWMTASTLDGTERSYDEERPRATLFVRAPF